MIFSCVRRVVGKNQLFSNQSWSTIHVSNIPDSRRTFYGTYSTAGDRSLLARCFFHIFNQRHFQLLLVTMAVLGKVRLIRATTLLFFVSLMIGMMGGSFAHGQEVSLKLGYAV